MDQQELVRRRHARREVQAMLQRAWKDKYDGRAWKDKYEPRCQAPGGLTAPEMKKNRTTSQTPLLAAGAFTAALEGVPAEDWCRILWTCRTIMLRKTSMTVKLIVNKMRLPADVRLSHSFWREQRNHTDVEKRNLVMTQLSLMTTWSNIITLDLHGLHWCNPFGFNCPLNANTEHTNTIASVVVQCSALTHLDLGLNWMGPNGAERLGAVLGQRTTLTHLNLSGNLIGPAGAQSLARVLGNFTALVHLDLSGNDIGQEGEQSLVGVLVHSTRLTHLDLGFNEIGADGAEILMMLMQCTSLTHVNLDYNFIDDRVLRALGTHRRGRDRGRQRK